MQSNAPSRAKSYFDQIKLPGNGARFLAGLIGSATPTFESEFLDFKGGHVLDLKGKDLLELWAKNLSCFGNSDGGVLIFGIDAPRGKAKSLSLVQDVAGLTERLKSLLPVVTEPPVQRVEIEAYPDPSGSNKGFVVCFIPASPWRPHQVKSGSQQNWFFVRATDNCIPCNHSTLRALFAPQFASLMEIQYRTESRPNVVYQRDEVFLQCWLENKGPATASETFVLYHCPSLRGEPTYNHMLWEETSTGKPGKALICKRSVHPEERIHFCDIPLGWIARDGKTRSTHEFDTFRFSVSVHNQAPIQIELTVGPHDIDSGSFKKGILVEKI